MSSTISFQSTSFTCTADGETLVCIPALQSSASKTISIISITKEIKQLLPSQFSADTGSGNITLLSGVTLNTGETLFVLYKSVQS